MSIAAVGASSLLQQYHQASSAKSEASETPGVADHDGDHDGGSTQSASSTQSSSSTQSASSPAGSVSLYA